LVFVAVGSLLACQAPNPVYQPPVIQPEIDAAIVFDAPAGVDRPSVDSAPAAADAAVKVDVPATVDAPAANDGGTLTLASGLIGYWKLDETSGSNVATDSSGKGNHGSLVNTSRLGWTTAGRVGGALRFDGVDDWVRIPVTTDSIVTTKAFTFAAWVNGVTNTGKAIFGRQYGATQWDHFVIVGDPAGFLGTVNNYVMPNTGCYGPAIPVNRWTHVALVGNNGFARGYIDGLQQCTLTYAPAFTTDTTPYAIGANDDRPVRADNQNFNGLIDEVVLYDRALTSAEIGRLSSGQSPL
jgi:hypothetical protein